MFIFFFVFSSNEIYNLMEKNKIIFYDDLKPYTKEEEVYEYIPPPRSPFEIFSHTPDTIHRDGFVESCRTETINPKEIINRTYLMETCQGCDCIVSYKGFTPDKKISIEVINHLCPNKKCNFEKKIEEHPFTRFFQEIKNCTRNSFKEMTSNNGCESLVSGSNPAYEYLRTRTKVLPIHVRNFMAEIITTNIEAHNSYENNLSEFTVGHALAMNETIHNRTVHPKIKQHRYNPVEDLSDVAFFSFQYGPSLYESNKGENYNNFRNKTLKICNDQVLTSVASKSIILASLLSPLSQDLLKDTSSYSRKNMTHFLTKNNHDSQPIGHWSKLGRTGKGKKFDLYFTVGEKKTKISKPFKPQKVANNYHLFFDGNK